MNREKLREITKAYIRYGIIASLIFIALIVLPMISSDLSAGWKFPDTTLGWVSYIVIRAIMGVITYLIFISFDSQALINIKNDERYINAYNKLYSKRDKKYIPMSPNQRKLKAYSMKAVTLSLTSILTAFVVIDAILSYNYNILLAYGLSIIFSVIFGIIQMLKTEDYWTEEFPQWVDYHLEQIEKEKDINGSD